MPTPEDLLVSANESDSGATELPSWLGEQPNASPRRRKLTKAEMAKRATEWVDGLQMLCTAWLGWQDLDIPDASLVEGTIAKLPPEERHRIRELILSLRALADALEEADAERSRN
jgi:hypothetical protein